MKNDYISREEAYAFFKDQLEKETGAYSKGRNSGLRVAMSAIMNKEAIPAADVVSRDAFNRILAENDTMRAQLAQIGKKPGDSMDDVRRVTPTVNYDDPYKPLWPHWDD